MMLEGGSCCLKSLYSTGVYLVVKKHTRLALLAELLLLYA